MNEIDVVMRFGHANDYSKHPGNCYLNGAMGESHWWFSRAEIDQK